MRKLIFVFVTLFVLNPVLRAQEVDSERSIVNFKISAMYVNTVRGELKDVSGTVFIDPDKLDSSIVDVCLEVSTINTENEKRDQTLKEEDFFHIEKYPRICFKADQIEMTSSNNFIATGQMKMHGIEKQMSISFSYQNSEIRSEFEIDRLDFGIGENYGSFTVGKKVSLDILIRLYASH
jgi:polyisoprenoid-binding protein YceI